LPKRLGAALDAALAHLPTISYELPERVGAISLSGAGDERHDDETSPLTEAIAIFNEALHAHNRSLAIVIDEIRDADLPLSSSIAASVHQSAATKAPILLAVAGLPQAEIAFKHIRTYTQRCDHLLLELLTRAEVANAIRIPIVDAGTTIEDAALDRLSEARGGYPFFIQLLASAAWNEHVANVIMLRDVECSIPPISANIEKTFYRSMLDTLKTRELAFAAVLAELGSGPRSFSDVAA